LQKYNTSTGVLSSSAYIGTANDGGGALGNAFYLDGMAFLINAGYLNILNTSNMHILSTSSASGTTDNSVRGYIAATKRKDGTYLVAYWQKNTSISATCPYILNYAIVQKTNTYPIILKAGHTAFTTDFASLSYGEGNKGLGLGADIVRFSNGQYFFFNGSGFEYLQSATQKAEKLIGYFSIGGYGGAYSLIVDSTKVDADYGAVSVKASGILSE
jgi:hypothetical protein